MLILILVPAWALAEPDPPAPGAPPAPTHTVKELRQICSEAMNGDPTFANDIIAVANRETALEHEHAAERVATNERHVILAYAAMWVVAALFVIFLWRRQLALRSEITRLRRDLESAVKEPAK